MIYPDILATVGNTPVVRINRLAPDHVEMYVKCEAFNPLSSVKDRLALGVINDAGVPAGPALDLAPVFADPQVLARETLVETPHPEAGTFKATGLPCKLRGSPGGIHRRPPLLGEHTDEVLAECGLSRGEIADLRQAEVI